MAETRHPLTRFDRASGSWQTAKRARSVLSDPRLNKGVAFPLEERRALGLLGLMPPRVLTLEEQAPRAYEQYLAQPTDLAKNVFLTLLHDRNETLFYRLLADHLAEMLPIVYTPTIGEAIQRYSHEYRRPRGVYLSADDVEDFADILASTALGPDEVDLLVATDAQGILGIGDWGVGGIEIAVGKLAVYTAAGGIDPSRTLAVMLDVGTDRAELLDDPLYLGLRQPRLSGAAYDRVIDAYVQAAGVAFPGALLHWEDFGTSNARRILSRYRSRICTFNDDMQGTGAVNLAAVLSGVAASGVPLREHRVVVFGAGTAGIGIADQLRDAVAADGIASGMTREQATARFWCVDRYGLLVDDQSGLHDFQAAYARPATEVAGWPATGARDPDGRGGIDLAEVVRRVRPSVLIGTSAQRGAFAEGLVREMASHTERPIILPMSNPTSLAEARPADLLAWTGGRALVATGSPFPPVTLDRTTYVIAQANNALIFPGLGLGTIVSRASAVTDGMLLAAAQAVAGLVDAAPRGSPLLPQVEDLPETSVHVAAAVARAAVGEGVARATLSDDVEGQMRAAMWRPVYRPVVAV